MNLEDAGGIAIASVDRPPANALDPELLEDALSVLDELSAAPPAAVVITGGERFFSAGVDLKALPGLDAGAQRAMVDGINRLLGGWYAFPRPVVCAVGGHAIAGGLVLALCGDRRIGSPGGRLGLTELRAGVPYPQVAIDVIRAELEPGVARSLVLGAGLVDAPRALELGILDELTEPGRLLERSLESARQLAELPSETYGQVKRQLRAEVIARAEHVVASQDDPLATGWLGAASGPVAGVTLRGPAGARAGA